jgi:hypothetical protein
MGKHIAYSLVIGCSLMHVLCCGVPLLLGATSLAATLGIAGGSLVEVAWFEAIEVELMVVSGLVLVLTAGVQLFDARKHCCDSQTHQQKPCTSSKDITGMLFKLAVALYAFSVLSLLID